MNFRTELNIPPSGLGIDHSKRGFMAGSCFSENIFRKLTGAGFNVTANPTGILFNPGSISSMIRSLASGRRYAREDLIHDGNLWFSWDHHGSFSDIGVDSALQRMNSAASAGSAALETADYVIITFGTAWIYELAGSGRVVANCHKQPSAMFERRRLTAGEIAADYSDLMQNELKDKTVIFTLSPVRHLKDGFDGNSLSKAILRTAIGEIVGSCDNAAYFPAYELVTDDLRDYRFYAEDMLHPSQFAVDYIWTKFCDWAFDERTLSLLPRIEALRRAAEHRPFNVASDAHQKFMAIMREELSALSALMPEADFSKEKEIFGLF